MTLTNGINCDPSVLTSEECELATTSLVADVAEAVVLDTLVPEEEDATNDENPTDEANDLDTTVNDASDAVDNIEANEEEQIANGDVDAAEED